MEPTVEDITVDEVQDVLDNIAYAARYKSEDNVKPIDNADLLLRAIASPVILLDPIAYKILQQLTVLMKDGLLEKCGNVIFETVDKLFSLGDASNSPTFKTTVQEIATGLFSHACSALQGGAASTVPYIPYLLRAMMREEGSSKWNAYSCCGPLLMTRLEAFQPHAALLLQVMPGFPETLSVIHDLYQMAPSAFIENMPLLVKLYESNVNGQLSILDIVRDLAKLHPEIVAPHLAALQLIANDATNDDAEVVKEIEATCASSIPVVTPLPPPLPSSDEKTIPEEFDERVEYLNKLSEKCHDVPALREFLQNNQNAVRYLRHVGQVMPLPTGIDYGMQSSEISNVRTSLGGSGGKSSLKKARESWKISRDSFKSSRDSKTLLSDARRQKNCGLSTCFGQKDVELPEHIMLRFHCATAGSHCVTGKHPFTVRASMPPPWLKLAAVLYAQTPPMSIQIRKWQTRGDNLDALLEIAQSIEMAAAAKRSGGGGRSVDGFEVLTAPFLGTDDLGDLIVELREQNLFHAFQFNIASSSWVCSACSTGAAQKANISGFLVKKGRRTGREVKRFYMLDEHHLFYATSDRAVKPRRRIPIWDIVYVRELPNNGFEITVRDEKKQITLQAPTTEHARRWIAAIQKVIEKQNEMVEKAA